MLRVMEIQLVSAEVAVKHPSLRTHFFRQCTETGIYDTSEQFGTSEVIATCGLRQITESRGGKKWVGYLHKSFLSLACLDRFRSKPVSERNSRSLVVRSRSSSTGRMRSCSNATWLSTDAHCKDEREVGD